MRIKIKLKPYKYIVMSSTGQTDAKLHILSGVFKTLTSIFGGSSAGISKCIDNPGPPICIASPKSSQVGGLGKSDSGLGDNVQLLFINLANKIMPVFEKVIFGPGGGNLQDAKMNLDKKLKLLEDMTNDPAMQEALKKLAESYAVLGVQTLDAVRPSIDMVTDETWNTLSEVSSRSAVGAINTGLNFTEAALGEIPVMGGVIALIMAFMRGMNSAMLAAAPAIQSGIGVAGTLSKTIPNVAEGIKKGVTGIQGQFPNKELVNSMVPPYLSGGAVFKRAFKAGGRFVQKALKENGQKGGKSSNKLYKRINRATKRLHKSIYRFTVRRKRRKRKTRR
tara:strand:- start:354 stop:1358 length:1005 start_codon:yes stop_codon:yes gene_type:complete